MNQQSAFGINPQANQNRFHNPQNEQQQKNIVIDSLTLIAKGGYKKQYLRPYTMNLPYQTLGNLENMLNMKKQMGGNKINPIDIVKAAPDMLLPSSMPIGSTNIVNGWSEKRAVFILKGHMPGVSKYSKEYFYIQGYTEHWGVTKSGVIDTNLKFIINTVITTIGTINPNTMHENINVTAFYSLIHNEDGTVTKTDNANMFGASMYQPKNSPTDYLILARPEDVITSITQQRMFDNIDNVEVHPSSIVKMDGNAIQAPILTERVDTTSVGHVSKTMTGILTGQQLAGLTYNDGDILDSASSALRTDNINSVELLNRLENIHGGVNDTYFTLEDMFQIDPSFRTKTPHIFESGTGTVSNYNATLFGNDSVDTMQPTEENRIFTIVGETMVAILTSLAVEHIVLTLTNETGVPEVKTTGPVHSMIRIPPMVASSAVETKVLHELFPIISRNNMQSIFMVISASITEDTNMSLSLNSNPVIHYKAPTFADNLNSPIITGAQGFNEVTNGYKNISDLMLSHL